MWLFVSYLVKGAQVSLTIRGDDGDIFRPIQGVSGAFAEVAL